MKQQRGYQPSRRGMPPLVDGNEDVSYIDLMYQGSRNQAAPGPLAGQRITAADAHHRDRPEDF
jgi:hypothetical protein